MGPTVDQVSRILGVGKERRNVDVVDILLTRLYERSVKVWVEKELVDPSQGGRSGPPRVDRLNDDHGVIDEDPYVLPVG